MSRVEVPWTAVPARAPVWLAATVVTLGVVYPLATFAQRRSREDAAAARLVDLVRAQQEFRAAGGHGFYAASFDSLTTPCPGGVAAPPLQGLPHPPTRGPSQEVRTSPERGRAPLQELQPLEGGYRFEVRAARGAAVADTDCHGRATTDAFLITATPSRVGENGLRAFAAGADGRVYVFFDGVAPDERDIASGLAMPLDAMVAIP